MLKSLNDYGKKKKTSPLHDGAVVIAENKIKSASCILPLTDIVDLPAQFGLRHRAGIGVTEANEATSSYPKKPARSATPNRAKVK
ncbi:DNA integrity scanning protein DisA nucleotide-binding domain protein [Mucilaginibacter humi]|uniref:DNA integrity scanning protein DisA nucleotide-binding domain protein n=1 Tax=Mucilaginibacter humi TaxID=2732510 RepID=UPI00293BD5A6|nr:DNA integrity scanning protein DisA nucleotide-binding domain protein [Mucilaginibacter humi]